MDSTKALKPCPFCGGDAELDYSRHFRAMSSGNLEKAVAIYCLQCSADMTLCRSDHREYDAEQLADILTENWNRRTALSAQGEAAQPAAEGWRTMDSAPRDGTAILIVRETEFQSEEGWHVVRWDDDRWQVHDGKFDHPLRGPEPTGWMPPPASRNAASQEGRTDQ